MTVHSLKEWRRREKQRRPTKYLKTKDLEAAGVGPPRFANSRMIARIRWAQSARNDRKPRCRYKTGTAGPPASVPIHKPRVERKRFIPAGRRGERSHRFAVTTGRLVVPLSDGDGHVDYGGLRVVVGLEIESFTNQMFSTPEEASGVVNRPKQLIFVEAAPVFRKL